MRQSIDVDVASVVHCKTVTQTCWLNVDRCNDSTRGHDCIGLVAQMNLAIRVTEMAASRRLRHILS